MRGGYDIRTLVQAEHLQQVELLRQAQQEQIWLSSSGRTLHRADYKTSHFGGRGWHNLDLAEEWNPKVNYMKQQHLASLADGHQWPAPGVAEAIALVANNQPISSSSQHTNSTAQESTRNAATSKKGKSELLSRDSDSKVTIVSCPARGMPAGHDTSTAYFRIPQNIKHGTKLVCSYYGCRNAGIQLGLPVSNPIVLRARANINLSQTLWKNN